MEQYIDLVKSKAHFMDEIDEDVLRHYKKALEAEGYAGKTIDTRLNIVFFLLKKNGIKARIPADEMPIIEEEPATPYSDTDLRKLWAEIDKHYDRWVAGQHAEPLSRRQLLIDRPDERKKFLEESGRAAHDLCRVSPYLFELQ